MKSQKYILTTKCGKPYIIIFINWNSQSIVGRTFFTKHKNQTQSLLFLFCFDALSVETYSIYLF